MRMHMHTHTHTHTHTHVCIIQGKAIWLIIGCEMTIPPPNKKEKERKEKKNKARQLKTNKALNNYCFNAIPS